MLLRRQHKEFLVRNLFLLIAAVSITVLLAISLFLFIEGVPIFEKVSLWDFIFEKYWYPTSDPAEFGIPTISPAVLRFHEPGYAIMNATGSAEANTAEHSTDHLGAESFEHDGEPSG